MEQTGWWCGAFRRVTALATPLLVVAVVGCAGNQSKGKSAGLEEANVGDVVTVSGTLSQRGSTPLTILMLEVGDGDVVVIQSSTIQEELRMLSGMSVSIQGRLLPRIEGEAPLVDVQRYELMALPTGEVPLVGTVRLQDGQCVLETADATRYWIRGEFVRVLKQYEGAKVWVVGTVGDDSPGDQPEGSVPMNVTGYGVLASN